MSDLSARIADLSPEKRELLLERLGKKRADGSRSHISAQPRDSNVFPLSFAQQRLWFLDQISPGTPVYNIPVAVRLAGPLDRAVLERSMNEIVRRHEALRTTFATTDGKPVQIIAPSLAVPLPIVDLQPFSPSARDAEVERLIAEESLRSFDLTHGPLLRTTLLRLDERTHVLLLTMHHIVSDGWSMTVFIRELEAFYAAFAAGQPAPLPALPIQYADYAVWQSEWLQGAVLEEQRAYWRSQLAGTPPVLELPLDHPRAPVRTFRAARHSALLPRALSQALVALSRQEEVTLFMTLLAAFQALLHRYSGQDDIVIGSPIAGRTRPETKELIGFFLNTLVLRTDLSGNPAFRELLRRAREVCLGAYAHQDLPFEKLLEELQPERDLSHTPLFQVFFNMLNVPNTPIELPGLTLELLAPPEIGSKFDLTLYAEERGDQIQLDLVYNADLFSPARMEELLGQLELLLSQVAADPDARIDEVTLVTPAARALLPEPTAPLDPAWEGAVHTGVARQAQWGPERPAMIDALQSWTYAELEARSNQLANYLIEQGVRHQDVVAIYGHRSATLVWALMGVLKAGAAFTILDPAYPAARLIDCLELAQPRGWIQIEAAGALPDALEDALTKLGCPCRLSLAEYTITEARGILMNYSTDDPGVVIGPDDVACVGFTSGSTGKPKGILGRQGPLTHFLPWQSQTFGLSESDRFSMLSGLAHDPLQRDIFTPLWLGATLCIPAPEDIRVPGRLAEWMRREAITIAHLTPALGQLLTETSLDAATEIPSLRYAFIVGDVLTRRDVARIRTLAPAITCVNFYGSTETQRAVGYYVVPNDEPAPHDDAAAQVRDKEILPLGRGMKDVQLLVLNRARRLAGVGEVGEIYVRSPHVAKGYLGDEALTAARFIPDPFGEGMGDGGWGMEDSPPIPYPSPPPALRLSPIPRLYKTGDLGRYLPDGNVEFAGRADLQVKIRGFRVELGEIEAVLGQHADVREAVVLAREDVPGDKRLVAYVVPKIEDRGLKIEDSGSDAPDPLSSILYPLSSELRGFLKETLPDYMVPSAFVVLDALPLTPNGKVDRKALPAPDSPRREAQAGYVAPQTELERIIAAVWQETLHAGVVGVDDNFFDLGGTSVHIVQVHSKLREALGREVPLIEMFKYPTVGSLARYLAQEHVEQPSFQAVHERVRKQKGDPERQKHAGADQGGIAIVGMSGRFPGAENIDEFWRNLRDGVESIATFPEEEQDTAGLDPAWVRLPNYIRASPLLKDIESFDAGFFNYTPREAAVIDPQHRLFLECAWEALEHAGYDTETYKGWIGVYAGVALNVYLWTHIYSNPDLADPVATLQMQTSNDRDYLTTRVSYKLNLRGPSINLQSACSTSLVAVHLACQALLSYQCDIGLAGGVSVRVPHKTGYWYQEGGMYSPDGHCRTFDARAGGTVFGSGAGVVVLKRLADAIADGDQIYAVIKGSAINNDGSDKVGFTAPGVEGQASVIAMAQGSAGVDPETISYVEAHGTATPLGDPIEVAALTQVFRASTQKKQFCAIGSVKTNIGHASAAAGVAGLIKTALALKHSQLPPSLHFEQPNPKIDFANSPFYVNTKLSEWRANGTPRRAGVSSFGVGGTNAHAVLEEAPPLVPSGVGRPWQLLVLAAKTETALEKATDNLVAHLKERPDLNLADVAYTLQVGRRAFNRRRVLVCRDLDDAVRALEARDPKRVMTLVQDQRDRPVVFMFSGQGAQYVNMARGLYEAEPVFREVVDQCAELLKPRLGLDLRDLLYPEEQRTQNKEQNREYHPGEPRTKNQEPGTNDDRPTTTDQRRPTNDDRPTSDSARPFTPSPLHPFTPSPIPQLDQTQYTQPALFVVEYALARLWTEWGVRPQAMIGHSIGEYVAACLAGVFSLEDALMLVAARGKLMQQLPGGTMLMVSLPEHEVQTLLDDQLALAAINAPSRCVVAGPTEAVEALERRLAERGVDCRRLHTSHAFHSRMMDPILEPFTMQVQRVTLNAPSIPFVSNVTGMWISAEDATDPRYWARHLRQAVRFADGVRALVQEPDRVLLEVGPGQTLTTLARQHPDKGARQVVLPSLRHPQDQQPDAAFVLNTLGQLWLAGVSIDWPGVYAHERRLRLPLPTYPFERRRYWIEPGTEEGLIKTRKDTLAKKQNVADWFYIPAWKQSSPPVWEPGDLNGQATRWLVFQDECGLGAQLASRLEREGQEVVTVTPGQQFAKLGERAYAVDPRRPEDYDALLGALHAAKTVPQTIMHLWSVTPDDQPRTGGRPEQLQDRGFYSLLFLAQAFGKQNMTDDLHIGIVSNHMQKVGGETALCPEKATVLGPCKVIPQEYPNITCQSIDIVLPAAGTLAEDELVEQLLAELAARSGDRAIAYRGYDRWVQTYDAVRLGQAIEGKTRLREQGVYLITGGLGGIGLVLAEYLARTARARLVLTGRSAFPAREEWDAWLATHGDEDKVSANIHKLRALEALGAQVLVVSADVADEAQMRAAVGQARARFGAINGVVHSAGIAGGGLIQLKTPEIAGRVLAPKVTAVQTLEAVLADERLDFLVLCSSTIALIGGMGQVDYCAANSFLDAYAHYNTSRRGVFTVSINWDAWQEVGMAVNAAASYGLKEARPALQYEELGHPLLNRWAREQANREVYQAEVSEATHWVLAEHKIMGTGAVPGTAYLEMARAACERRFGSASAEIQGVFFLTPLMVGPDEKKEVHTILEGDGDLLDFRVVSRPATDNGAAPKWQEHVRGKVGRLSDELIRWHNIAEIIKRCDVDERIVSAEDLEKVEKFVYWGPRWRSLKHVYVGQNEGIGLLELPDQFAADLGDFGLHPALLDVATAFASGIAGDGGSYLPLSYRALKVHGALPKTIYSYVRYKVDTNSKRETLTFDITIMDEQGQELVDIESFTMKRVNETSVKPIESAEREQQIAVPSALNGAGRPHESPNGNAPKEAARLAPLAVGILSQEGVDAFTRILSRNRLPQIVVSTKDLHAAIERANSLKQSRLLDEIDSAQRYKPTHARPEMATAYVAPRNEVERRIAAIWQNTLGIEAVGVHDNFFDLGGDSVLAIQIIAKAGDAGMQITPAQLFEYQTIADLAAVLSPGEAVPEPAPASGPLPLTPIQHWFFAQDLPDPHYYNQALLLELRQPFDPERLERALQQLLAHHDALRLRFTRAGDGWRQQSAEPGEPSPLTRVDLAALPEAERAAAIAQATEAAQTGLRLEDGPLVRAALFDAGRRTPGLLLIVIHQLAVDRRSWDILLENLQTAYEQAGRGEEPALPRTTSFQRWAEQLAGYARSEPAYAELAYWSDALRLPVARLPLDGPAGAEANTFGSAQSLRVALDAQETRTLLEQAPAAYQTQTDEILLAALVETLAPWTGERALLVDLAGDGRAALDDEAQDLARTIGWFDTRFPVLLNLADADGPGAALKAVKERRRSVPKQGIGYGALRYLSTDPAIMAQMQALPQAELSFSYRGEADRAEATPFRVARAPRGPFANPQGRRPYLLEVTARVADGQLLVEWTYGGQVYNRATIERLAHGFMVKLRALIDHCLSPDAGGYTPSDFPEAGLNQDDLDRLLSRMRR